MDAEVVWISRPRFTTAYRAIVAREGHTVGLEAVVRGRLAGAPVDLPALLASAHDDRAARQVQRRAAESVVSRTAQQLAGRMLFVELPAAAPRRASGWVDALLEQLAAHRLVPQQLVVQADAGAAAALAELLAPARDGGVRLALTGVGDAGTSEACEALRPDFVKVAPAVVREVTAPGGLLALEQVLRTADRAGAEVVADGVVTRAQLDLLHACGVHLAQGGIAPAPQPDVPEQRRPRRLRLLAAPAAH